MKRNDKNLQSEAIERKHFNTLAKLYDDNYGYNDDFTKYKIIKKASFLVDLIEQSGLNKSSLVLEIGCGTGVYTRELVKFVSNLRIYAIDISPEMIFCARRNSLEYESIEYIISSAYATGIPSNSVDIVYGFYVLHHLNVKMAMSEIHRILKPGGLVFFYEPNILNPWVFFVKSIPFLKKFVGDSPGEYAINPLTFESYTNGFEVIDISTTEFVVPFKILSFNLKVTIDKFTDSVFKQVPLLSSVGGSVKIILKKTFEK